MKRWLVVSIFALASAWNYLDRLLLAASAPAILAEFHLSNTDYSWLLSAFALSYALASPFVGWFLDRLGLHVGVVCAVGLWSLATLLTGWSGTFLQLLGARVFLGIWESAGVPAAGKLNGLYLEPKHRAIGAAMTQVGLTIGSVAAVRLANAFSNWRTPFFICGALGILWIPLWWFMKDRVATFDDAPRGSGLSALTLLRDPRLVRLSVANLLSMGIYTLSSNWTTLFLAKTYHLTGAAANDFAWFPPIASTLGGFAGGWFSMRRIRSGGDPVQSRVAAILISSIGCVAIIAAPMTTTPLAATLTMSVASFWVVAGSVNLYTIPVDIWGGASAGAAISTLVFSYGILQMVISPVIGSMVDRFGSFAPVCWLVGVTPLMGWWLIRKVRS